MDQKTVIDTFSDSFSEEKNLGQIELVLYLTDPVYLDESRLKQWSDHFYRITAAGTGSRPDSLPVYVNWSSCGSEESRAEVWNRLLAGSEREWVLFLEDNEAIRMADFPDISRLSPARWSPALILQEGELGDVHYYYQMRLVPGTIGPVFDGKNLPDCTRMITRENIQLSEHVIRIERPEPLFINVDPEDELSVQHPSPSAGLILGNRLIGEGRYVYAAAQFRRILRIEKLLPFDRLGAVNGMARCLTEQYKWQQAIGLAEQSLEAERRQRVPYLILFRIYQLNKQWNKAYSVLEEYQTMVPYDSLANFDKAIDEEECLAQAVRMASEAGMKKEAALGFEKLLLKKIEPDKSLSRKLLHLSIELENYSKATFYFNQLFEEELMQMEKRSENFPEYEGLPESQETALHHFMTSFMDRGWYDFVLRVYSRLYQFDPANGEYRRRLILSLAKTGKMDQARELIAAGGGDPEFRSS